MTTIIGEIRGRVDRAGWWYERDEGGYAHTWTAPGGNAWITVEPFAHVVEAWTSGGGLVVRPAYDQDAAEVLAALAAHGLFLPGGSA